jgi:hypothetical protein
MKRRKRLLWLLILLYAVTWVGGWITYVRDVDASTWASYRNAQKRNTEWQAAEPPGAEVPIYLELREGGPAAGVDWCLPVFPGVLLADSYQVLGPLNGRGGAKLVLYYGTGTVVVCELWGWRS